MIVCKIQTSLGTPSVVLITKSEPCMNHLSQAFIQEKCHPFEVVFIEPRSLIVQFFDEKIRCYI